ncbi:MAG: YabP/YqfC family sporulation protein [Clostridia bacterium]|nr:YabP/YqfC family sporulation protein [Clostridia bacterium]
MMKKERGRGAGRSVFRLEWESDRDGVGRLFLFGVATFGRYGENEKRFLTADGAVSVRGERLSVKTYRSGGVEVCGSIREVSFDPFDRREEEIDRAND